MHPLKKRADFHISEAGIEAKEELERMFESAAFNTQSTYTANIVKYPENVLTFVDRHMDYLVAHPEIDVRTYLANIRLMTRIR